MIPSKYIHFQQFSFLFITGKQIFFRKCLYNTLSLSSKYYLLAHFFFPNPVILESCYHKHWKYHISGSDLLMYNDFPSWGIHELPITFQVYVRFHGPSFNSWRNFGCLDLVLVLWSCTSSQSCCQLLRVQWLYNYSHSDNIKWAQWAFFPQNTRNLEEKEVGGVAKWQGRSGSSFE